MPFGLRQSLNSVMPFDRCFLSSNERLFPDVLVFRRPSDLAQKVVRSLNPKYMVLVLFQHQMKNMMVLFQHHCSLRGTREQGTPWCYLKDEIASAEIEPGTLPAPDEQWELFQFQIKTMELFQFQIKTMELFQFQIKTMELFQFQIKTMELQLQIKLHLLVLSMATLGQCFYI